MRLIDVFRNLIRFGIDEDPRGKDGIERLLNDRKKEYEALSDDDKQYFDKESLVNPYFDSRLLYGNDYTEIRYMMVGIDCETPELLLADRLKANGHPIDMVLTHHPKRYDGFENELKLQIDLLHEAGLPINIAEGIMLGRIGEVERSIMPSNNTRYQDAARLLDISFASTHTAADNHVYQYLKKKIEKAKPYKVKDIINLLLEEPEYKDAKKNNTGLKVLAGSPDRRAGEVYFHMTGGTGGPKEELEWLAKQTSVGTIVAMHMTDERKKLAEEHHINVVIAGHMASDSLGMNLLLDKLITIAPEIDIAATVGFFRHSRL